jgi:hypothetical protein
VATAASDSEADEPLRPGRGSGSRDGRLRRAANTCVERANAYIYLVRARALQCAMCAP